MGLAVIWLRSVLYAVWFYGLVVVMATIGLLLPTRWLNTYGGWWSRLALGGLWLVGIRVVVTGREHLPASGAMLIASQHQSEFDTLLWLHLVPDCRYVVKAELLRMPLYGVMVRRSGQIAVDRAGGAATMRGLLRDGGAALAAGRQLVIFPEGTRVTYGEEAPLQPGVAALAARSGLGVIPVATDSGRCWPGRAFLKRPGRIHVDILPPLPAGLPRAALMEQLARAYREARRNRVGRDVDNSVGGTMTDMS